MFVIGSLLFLIFYESNGSKIIGSSISSPGYLKAMCYGQPFENVSFLHYNHTNDVKKIEFVDCVPDKISFKIQLQQMDINVKALKSIILKYEANSTRSSFNAAQFENLNIEKLNIVNSRWSPHIRLNSTEFLKPLRNLQDLIIEGVILPPLIETINIKTLWLLHGSSLGAFGGCKNLQEMRISNWNLTQIPDRWLENCTQLTFLDIWNIQFDLRKVLGKVSSLQILQISNCSFGDFPAKFLSTYVKDLQILNLWDNHIRRANLSDLNLKFLTKLNIDEDMNELEGLPQLGVSQFEINLDGTPIRKWKFQKSDYEMLNPNVSVSVHSNNLTLDCDCQHGWFVRAVKHRRVALSGLQTKCSDGTDLARVARDVVECVRSECSDCTCRRQWSDNSTVARCGGTATRVPRVRGLRALHAAGNRIETLSVEDLPDTLLFLDLSGNHLSNIDKNTTIVLFSVKRRRVRLTNNPLVCHCSNQLLIEMIQTRKMQVLDYSKLWCMDGEQKRSIHNVIPSELCAAELQIQRRVDLNVALAVIAGLLGLTAVSGVLYCRYKQHVKVYLFARGYCMWCLHEEEVDSGRCYDAFLSFSHGDEEFVMEEILPQLDSEYKLCLHFRDWVVGEFIPAQITRSVEQSRRTIIVLSKNFVQSVWGLLEFRTAHMSALNEGRARVIVIVLDDVIDDVELAPELRSYIRTNTYVRWGDKWFWDRLRYAMPYHRHRDVRTVNISRTEPVIDMTTSPTCIQYIIQ